MAFCGQCGNLLAPNATKCPRCGAPIERPGNVDEKHSNTPTIHTVQGNVPPDEGDYQTWQSISQQGTARMADRNRQEEQSNTTIDPYHPPTPWEQTSTPHGPAGSFYPPQTPPYPVFPTSSENTPFTQPGEMSYPGNITSPTTDYPEHPQFPTPPTTAKKTSRALTLAIIAFLLAAALTTMLVFARAGILQQILQQNTVTPTVAIPSPTVVSRTPEQQARIVINQYFHTINNKDYRAAYNLWAPPPSSYNDFANGFTHTRHDYIQLGTIAQQQDGTVQVPITITALTDTGTKDTFSGYYIVGQQPDNSWKITRAKINPGTGA